MQKLLIFSLGFSMILGLGLISMNFSEKENNSVEVKTTTSQAKMLNIGDKAPDFEGPTPEGKMLSLEEVKGKYTLVEFWAAWCRPCRVENPKLVKVYEKYHDQGFNIIGVSLDRNKNSWQKAIEKDGLTWSHVSNLKFWQDPIARKYNVRFVPMNYLIDEEGVIVARNLRSASLERKLKELLE